MDIPIFTRLFYLSRARLWGIKNSLVKGDWKSSFIWSLVVLGILVGLYFIFLGILRKVDALPVIGAVLNRYIMVMFLLSLMGMLVFSNVVTALGTCYASAELPLILVSPLPYRSVFASKFLETCFTSSWMVLLITTPYLWAFGKLYGAQTSFYLLCWAPMVPFFTLATSIGLTITFFIARVFPVHQTRNLLRFLMVLAGAVALLLFRIMRPEQLVNPTKIQMLFELVDQAWNPRLQYSPAGWTSRVILATMGQWSALWEYDLELLLGCGFGSILLVYLIARAVHIPTWLSYQESSGAAVLELSIPEMLRRMQLPEGETPASLTTRIEKLRPLPRGELKQGLEDLFGFLPPAQRKVPVKRVLLEYSDGTGGRIERLFRRFSLPVQAVLVKDIKTFYRSPVLWTQMMLMVLIIFIYVYNIHLLPIETMTLADRLLIEGLGFLNVGFVSLITVALALRFGFPAVSMEGRGFFLIHSSPMGLRQYVTVKFLSNLVPLLIVSEFLILVSSWLLETSHRVAVLGAVDTFFLTIGITALSLYFGTVYVNFSAESFTRIPSGFGGMVFMVASMIFVTVVLAVQAYPFWLCFKHEVGWESSHAQAVTLELYLKLAATVAASCFSTLFVTWAALRRTERRLRYLEEGAHIDSA